MLYILTSEPTDWLVIGLGVGAVVIFIILVVVFVLLRIKFRGKWLWSLSFSELVMGQKTLFTRKEIKKK